MGTASTTNGASCRRRSVDKHEPFQRLRDVYISGIDVHIAARVAAAAVAGEVLVSRIVVDLVAGSGLSFAARSEHAFKGVAVNWGLFAVED